MGVCETDIGYSPIKFQSSLPPRFLKRAFSQYSPGWPTGNEHWESRHHTMIGQFKQEFSLRRQALCSADLALKEGSCLCDSLHAELVAVAHSNSEHRFWPLLRAWCFA